MVVIVHLQLAPTSGIIAGFFGHLFPSSLIHGGNAITQCGRLTTSLWRGEKSRLGRCILGVAKVTQTNADQAKALLWTQVYSFSER